MALPYAQKSAEITFSPRKSIGKSQSTAHRPPTRKTHSTPPNSQCHGELRYASWRLAAVLLLAGADVASFPVPALLGCGQVGWAAHAAGALAGPLLGLAIFPSQSKKDARGRSFVRFVRLCSAVSLVLLVVGAVLGNVYLIALPQLRRPS